MIKKIIVAFLLALSLCCVACSSSGRDKFSQVSTINQSQPSISTLPQTTTSQSEDDASLIESVSSELSSSSSISEINSSVVSSSDREVSESLTSASSSEIISGNQSVSSKNSLMDSSTISSAISSSSSSSSSVSLSSDKSLTVTEIFGVEVINNQITVSTAVWNQIKSGDIKANCEYQLAEKASLNVNLDQTNKTIIFEVTAEDLSKASINICVIVLSNDTSIEVSKVCGQTVINSLVTLSVEQWITLSQTENLSSLLTLTIAKGATYTASFNQESSKIVLDITAEDGTTATEELSVVVEDLFGTYATGLGDANGFSWDATTKSYVNSNTAICGVYKGGQVVQNNYKINLLAGLTLTQDGEFIISAYGQANRQIRFIVKVISATQVEIASDYSDGLTNIDYTVHRSNVTYNGPLSLGLIVTGGQVAMLYNGDIVYRRALENFTANQLVVSANQILVQLSNIEINTSVTQVEQSYQNATANYKDNLVGNTIGSTNNLNKCVEDLNKGTVRIDQSNTTANVPMVSFRYNGNPVVGEYFAVTGTIRTITVSGKSGHITFMCYQDNDNFARFILNRRSGDQINNTCYYRYKNNGVNTPNTGNTQSPYGNAMSSGLDYTANFAFIYTQNKLALYVEGKLMMQMDVSWGYCNAILEIPQNVDITYSNLYATTSQIKVEEILTDCETAQAVTFGKYGESIGVQNGFSYDNALGGYATNIVNGATYYDCGVYLDGEILSNRYSFSALISFPALVQNGEFVISAYSRNNKQIRYIIRAINTTQIEIASDYRDDSSYLDYTVHVSAFNYADSVNVGFIVCDGQVAMLYNGQTIYHRGLANFQASQLVIASSNSMQAVIKGLALSDNASNVEYAYNNALKGYKDALVGNTLGYTNNIDKCVSDLDKGTVRIEQTSGNVPMVSFRYNGNPVAGYSFAVTGKIRVVTTTDVSGHIGFMCYADVNNTVRYILNRKYSQTSPNNSCYYRTNFNGVWSPSSTTNTLCPNTYNVLTNTADWVADFEFIYDSGTIMLFIEDKLMMSFDTDWGYANAIIEIIKDADVTYSNLYATTDPLEVEKIRKECEQTATLTSAFVQNSIWSVNEDLSLIKSTYTYGKAAVKNGDGELISNSFYFKANMGILEPLSYGQGEILVCNSSIVGVRFVLEYLTDGTYQIFTQRVNGSTQSDWALVASNVKREMDLGVAVVNGKITFFVGNVRMYEYDIAENVKLYLGGEKCVVRVKNLVVNTNKSEVENLVLGLKEDDYVSGYLSRAQSLANSYSGAFSGQTLLMGSSSIDLWKERTDSNGNTVAGYLADLHDLPDNNNDGSPDVINVGIGGTTYRDWLSFYDILVEPFLPAENIVLYCGANDVYGGGSAENTFNNYKKLIDKILMQSPNVKIYYVKTNPSGTLYGKDGSGAVWARLTAYENMVEEYAKTKTENLMVIDMVNELKDANGPKASLWDADKTHLNREGYQVWASYIRKAMGLD